MAEVLWNGGGCFWSVNQTEIFIGVVMQEPTVVVISLEFQSTCLALSPTIRTGSKDRSDPIKGQGGARWIIKIFTSLLPKITCMAVAPRFLRSIPQQASIAVRPSL